MRGEPKGGVTDGLQQLRGPSWHLDLVEVTSMYFISLGREAEPEELQLWPTNPSAGSQAPAGLWE